MPPSLKDDRCKAPCSIGPSSTSSGYRTSYGDADPWSHPQRRPLCLFSREQSLEPVQRLASRSPCPALAWALSTVTEATIISRLLYASPAWWGLTSAEDRARLESFLKKLRRHQFL